MSHLVGAVFLLGLGCLFVLRLHAHTQGLTHTEAAIQAVECGMNKITLLTSQQSDLYSCKKASGQVVSGACVHRVG